MKNNLFLKQALSPNNSMRKLFRVFKSTFIFCALSLISILMLSCEKEEKEPSIVGTWTDYRYDYDSYSEYTEFTFFDDGLGRFMKWEKEYDNPVAVASSSYDLHFSYTYINNILTLNYGFGYIQKYHVNNLTEEYLDMSLGQHGGDGELYKRGASGNYGRNTFVDYSATIIGKWDINDSEKGRRYIICFRADGSYESQSSENGMSTITEVGTFAVDNSRVKLESNTTGSLLNGRIFMISGCLQWEAGGTICGGISLISENGIEIHGVAIS